MLSPRQSEWLLCLVTTPDRAHAIAGDLIEEQRHGLVALRVWFALLWESIAHAPLRMLACVVFWEISGFAVRIVAFRLMLTSHPYLWTIAMAVSLLPRTLLMSFLVPGREVAAGVAVTSAHLSIVWLRTAWILRAARPDLPWWMFTVFIQRALLACIVMFAVMFWVRRRALRPAPSASR
jgi:hypothetical protein